MLDFVITGCGRSGTKYAAKLFTAAGIPCTHERVFGVHAVLNRRPMPGFQRGPGEAAWPAAGILHGMEKPPKGLVVLQQVRNPVAVIRSMMGIKSFSRNTRYRQFIYDTVEDITPQVDPLLACMKFWVLWNEMTSGLIDHGPFEGWSYRVEDLAEGPLTMLALAGVIGNGRFTLNQVKQVLVEVPTNVHAKSRDQSVTWASLPEGEWKERIVEAAERYGYSKEELEAA